MIVISDTTPIISLLKIGHLSLLRDLFEKVYIPCAVYEELTKDKRFEEEATQIIQADYIEQHNVENQSSVAFLQRTSGLDRGESEAIILSDEMTSGLLLMDEALGRNVARNMGLHVMGTIGLLRVAYQEKLLTADEIRECVNMMQSSGRYISESLYQMILMSLED